MKMLTFCIATLLAMTLAAKNMTDKEVLKQEVFVQKLASRMNHHLRQRNKREIKDLPSHFVEDFKKKHVQKRQATETLLEENGHCSRKSVKINFDEIGWSHILAPKEIDYFYCEGLCDPVTVGPRVFTTSAAFVLYKLGMSPNSVIDGSCCSPSHLSSLELLVQTQPGDWKDHQNPMENLEVITIPDIMVTGCGCN